MFDRIPSGMPYSLERGLFPALLQSGARMFGFVRRDYWLDIGTLDKYLLQGILPVEKHDRRLAGCLARISIGEPARYEIRARQ